MIRRRLAVWRLAILLVVVACSAPASTAPLVSGSPVASAGRSATPNPTLATPVPATASPSPSASQSPEAGLRWSRLDPAGRAPAAREDHTWTVDPGTGHAYLYGGRDGGRVLGDLWRYDLGSEGWTRIAVEGAAPAARFGHTAVWLAGVGLVVWSGQAGPDFFADAWAFDPAAGRWERLPTNGPVPKARYGSCAAIGPDGRMWISHGFTEDTGRFADTWAYDFTRRRWSDVTPSGSLATIRCLHDCLWTADGRFLIYAGQTTGAPAIGDMWSRGVDGGWTEVPDVRPEARQLYALTVVGSGATGERAYVFGGGDRERGKLADLWSLELGALTWRKEAPIGDGPSGRSGAAMVADPAGARVLMFGGQTRSAAVADLWQLSLAD